MKTHFSLICLCMFMSGLSQNQVFPVPTKKQLDWQGKPFYLFMHFGPNTFTDLEWGKGTENEEVFNPSEMDCRQWCRIAKAVGATGIVITAKHHDGFCLWPSAYSNHTVARSSWKNGKGDVLKELSLACKEYGLSFGVYLSPWDRNHPAYGTAAYNDVYINMMKEVTNNYGPFFEFWWDGANGEGPNGKKQVYDWHRFESVIREIAPHTIVFSDIGPDIRWVGNENGIAGVTNWNLLDTAGFSRGTGAPSNDTLNQGNVNGKNWIPAECDVSIRPGWFYHAGDDSLVKSPEKLFDIYLKSVGRGANLILNVPPDPRGLISSFDSAALMGFAKLRELSFRNLLIPENEFRVFRNKQDITRFFKNPDEKNITPVKCNKKDFIEIRFKKKQVVNCIRMDEFLREGQRVKSFSIELFQDSMMVFSKILTTVGHQRIISFPAKSCNRIFIRVREAKAFPLFYNISVYHIPESLIEK